MTIYTNYPSDFLHKPRLLPADAVWNAYDKVGDTGFLHSGNPFKGRCAAFVGNCLGMNGAGVGHAYMWWSQVPNAWKVASSSGKTGTMPPVGALLHWDASVGDGSGHMAIMVEGSYLVSTAGKDDDNNGRVGRYQFDEFLKWMGRGYRGWSAPWICAQDGIRPGVNTWPKPGLMPDEFGSDRLKEVELSGVDYSVRPVDNTDPIGDDPDSGGDVNELSDITFDDYANVKRTSTKNIKFNPPLPNIHRRKGYYGGNGAWVDLDYKDSKNVDGAVLLESPTGYKWNIPAPTAVSKGSWSVGDRWQTGTLVRDYSFLNTVGDKNEDGFVGFEGDTRYGFKFLFNPNSYSETFQADLNMSPMIAAIDASKGNSLSTTSGAMNINLFLSRVDDIALLSETNWKRNYPSGITEEDRTMLLNTGTLWDIEFLFRLTNGRTWDTWRGKTSEIGLLLPMMVQLQLGPRLIRGIIDNVAISHQMFTSGMVPTVTQLTLNIARVIDAGTASDVNTSVNNTDTGSDGGVNSDDRSPGDGTRGN